MTVGSIFREKISFVKSHFQVKCFCRELIRRSGINIGRKYQVFIFTVISAIIKKSEKKQLNFEI